MLPLALRKALLSLQSECCLPLLLDGTGAEADIVSGRLDELEEQSRDGPDGASVPQSELARLLLRVGELDKRGENLFDDPGTLVVMIGENL